MSRSSTPIFFARDDGRESLVGHMARRNPHAAALEDGQPALAVFWGPHAYISSRWYEEKPEVPTWNYVQAHVRGVLDVGRCGDGEQGAVGGYGIAGGGLGLGAGGHGRSEGDEGGKQQRAKDGAGHGDLRRVAGKGVRDRLFKMG